MTSGWPGRLFRRPRPEASPPTALVALTEAFLDMDKRQSFAESAVLAAEQLFGGQRLREGWEPVANDCYAASAAYLAVTGEPETAGQAPSPGAIDETMRKLTAAARAVDAFYAAHRAQLESATSTLAAVPTLAQDAVSTANAVRQRLSAAAATYAGYPSVQSGARNLDDAVAALDAALAAGRAIPVRDAADRVRAAAAAVDQALAAAPGQAERARNALSSVTTRIAAVHTRAERLAPAYSSLLREFSAASSADLVHNERDSRRFIVSAEADLAQARTALAQANPERALELTASVRTQLADAEELVDAVTDRIELLRAIRDNPKAKENEVRFKLRDAQMLAVSRGMVAEWASVLDAQLERIDRVAGQLSGRNPDYWAYASGLDAVAAFIAGVVQRMRAQAPPSSGR